MKRASFIAAMMFLCSGAMSAQDNTTGKQPDSFLWDHTARTFGFYLPPGTALNDKISIKNDQDLEVKSVTVDQDILQSGKYTMPVSSLRAGDYRIAVTHDGKVLYCFTFGNREQEIPRMEPVSGRRRCI